MSKKKSAMVLGYTRTGIEVFLPVSSSPDMRTFTTWTRGDHVDASRILAEHGDREGDPEAKEWCKRWSKVHRTVGRSTRAALIRAAAETSIRFTRRRR
jgi:hypothetical protein